MIAFYGANLASYSRPDGIRQEPRNRLQSSIDRPDDATVLDNGRTLANQAVLQTINVFDPCIFQKDAMLHNGRENAASISYGGERSDERILDLNVISNDHRSS